eukprot:TRINITY_DN14956_c0_g1_i6.p1 TRINITY_DN14956_c0_g1~~TRINITY_DN14956_c0_g1_i6.p1  ORF type:complete len:111 (-),score=48.27 TRINITY_DN14956_c0_g1_i6:75-407(-)
MLRSLVGSEMCIRDSINAEYGRTLATMEFEYLRQHGADPALKDLSGTLTLSPKELELVHADLAQLEESTSHEYCKNLLAKESASLKLQVEQHERSLKLRRQREAALQARS